MVGATDVSPGSKGAPANGSTVVGDLPPDGFVSMRSTSSKRRELDVESLGPGEGRALVRVCAHTWGPDQGHSVIPTIPPPAGPAHLHLPQRCRACGSRSTTTSCACCPASPPVRAFVHVPTAARPICSDAPDRGTCSRALCPCAADHTFTANGVPLRAPSVAKPSRNPILRVVAWWKFFLVRRACVKKAQLCQAAPCRLRPS